MRPTVTNEDNQTYLRWGNLRYWVDDLNPVTLRCLSEACDDVAESDDFDAMLSSLAAAIDARVDATDGAVAVYIDRRNWEVA